MRYLFFDARRLRDIRETKLAFSEANLALIPPYTKCFIDTKYEIKSQHA